MNLKRGKKGLSTIVATLIIVLLVLVATGIIWVVIKEVILKDSEKVSLNSLTINLDIKNVKMSCDEVYVTVKRNVGEGDFIGLLFVMEGEEVSDTFKEYVSMKELEVRVFNFLLENLTSDKIKFIKVSPIFVTGSGEEFIGDIKDVYTISDEEVGEGGVCIVNCSISSPIALYATDITNNSFVANWESVPSAEGYYLEVARDISFTNLVVDNVDLNATSYEVNGVELGNTYYYRVRAYSDCISEESNVVSVQIIVPIEISSCMTLSESGEAYILTQNVTSTGTCFNISASNVTLDCQNSWIIYSTGGATNTYGIYTNPGLDSIIIKNCNILDGNFASSQTTRYGIYFYSTSNSVILNSFINTSNSNAIYLLAPVKRNNIISNVIAISNTGIGLSTRSVLSNFSNIIAISNTKQGMYIGNGEKNTFSDITASSNTGAGLENDGDSSNFSNIIARSNTNTGMNLQGGDNNFSNVISSSNTHWGMVFFGGQNNIFSNITASSDQEIGLNIQMQGYSNNTFSNITASSNTSFGLNIENSLKNTFLDITASSNANAGLYLNSVSNNTLSNINIISNAKRNEISVFGLTDSDFNSISNSTFISLYKNVTLVYLTSDCNSNTFYGNNFTETSGYYVEDLNGLNYYNTTINGVGEGNIWYNVMNGQVEIKGSVFSTLNPSLYIGDSGTGYPYNSINSFNKISENVVDYAPLTNVYG
ncbi:MAG TPA: right-handed parallel beta-helix repeat-containing protein [Candidatus Pacearchaeota archaeon]|nr:right-handed parallel beta-helix repeat-containing protein [Candidatus Pacearchaeota archaeon]